MNVALRNGTAPVDLSRVDWVLDIQRTISARSLEAGARYAAQNRVSGIVYGSDGNSIQARTRGSRPRPYDQHIRLTRRRDGRFDIIGRCSCPVGLNCKHVAAVLLVADPVKVGEPNEDVPQRLPDHFSAWLRGLERDAEDDGEEYPPSVTDRLLFVVAEAASNPGAMRIDPVAVRLKKSGEFGDERPYPAERVQNSNPAKFLRPSDRFVLRVLAARGRSDELTDQAEAFSRMLGTGRVRWQSTDGPVLREGPARTGRLVWQMRADGGQVPVIEAEADVVALRSPAPWYVDPEHGEMGRLDVGLPTRLAARVLAAPSVGPAEAVLLAAELRQRIPDVRMPLPVEPPKAEKLTGPVTPVLRLSSVPAESNYWSSASDVGPVPVARLLFRYGPVELPEAGRSGLHWNQGHLYWIQHDRAGERAAVESLEQSGLLRFGRIMPWRMSDRDAFGFPATQERDASWLSFLLARVPELREAGWIVETAADFPLRLVHAEGDFQAEITEGSGIDWFELSVGVMVEGEPLDLAPILATLIGSPAMQSITEQLGSAPEHVPMPLPLPDGRILTVPVGRIRPILTALIELHSGGMTNDSGRIGFSRLDAPIVAELETAAPEIVWKGGEALRAFGARLREAGGAIPAAALPAGFAGALRPYQQQGLDWLQFLREAELGGVLADDMGLGKTVQTLAHIAVEKAAARLDRPALIVCPTSLVPNWVSEAARFTPELRVLALHGPERQKHFDAIAGHDVVISTYPLLTRDASVLTGQEWHVVVLDEAQSIKNPEAITTKLAAGLAARQRLCLSGTPLQNHLGELWSLFDFLASGFLGSRKGFRSRYQLPIEKRGDEARRTMLARRLRPFLLRRTKEEVAADLPPKTEIVEQIEMEAGQRAIYDGVRMAMHKKVRDAIAARGLARSGIIVLDALLKMRQACCDPRLLKLETVKRAKAGSAKLDRLMEMLPMLREDGRRILLFSQFTSMLDLIKSRLDAAKIGYVELRGTTKDRAGPIARFQQGEVDLFLISLKAGGTGLNLTAADTVIHYDPWWNPAVEDQATDRAHRIGQDKPVFVHRLVTTGTIEEKMEELKRRKRVLVDGILNAERGGPLGLTEGDIEALFA